MEPTRLLVDGAQAMRRTGDLTADFPSAVTRRRFLARLGAVGLVVSGCDSGPPHAAHKHGATVTAPRSHPGPPIPRRLSDAVRGPVIKRGEARFATAAAVYNTRFAQITPKAIVQPLDAEDVRETIRWAVAHQMPLVAKSGGHSYAGYSTIQNGIVLDLRTLRSIYVNASAGTASIGPAAQLIDVYVALAAHGATLPAGSCPSVGISGHALGGGMGLAARAFGLTADNLIGAQLVTADGSLRPVTESTDPELLWALRGGGGGNFGVATELTFRLHRLPSRASWFFVSWPWSSAGEAIAAWQAWAPSAPDQFTSIMHLEAGGGTTDILVAGQYLGLASNLADLVRSLTSVPGATLSTGDQDYLGLQKRWAGCLHQPTPSCRTEGTRPGGALQRESFRAKSDYASRPFTAQAREVLISALEARQAQPGSGAILFDSYGGAINRIARDATAFVHRDQLFAIQYLSYGGGAAWLTTTHQEMKPYVSGYAYQNYIDPDLQGWRHAYYGDHYPRLVAVRERVDPDHYFNFPQAIGA